MFIGGMTIPHLWWLFLTQGNAARAARATTTFVTTPIVITESWKFDFAKNSLTTWKSSQMRPESAQPLWIPPRCWSTEVHPSLHQSGVH